MTYPGRPQYPPGPPPAPMPGQPGPGADTMDWRRPPPPSAYGDPGYGDPAYGDPAYGDPAYGDPAYDAYGDSADVTDAVPTDSAGPPGIRPDAHPRHGFLTRLPHRAASG